MSARPLVAACLAVASAILGIGALAPRRSPALAAALGIGVSREPGRWLLRSLSRVGASSFGRLVGRRNRHGAALAAGSAWRPDAVVGAKVVAAALLGSLSLLGPPPLNLLAPVFALLGFRTPDLLLAREARRRTSRAERELPGFLDLLSIATSAGLPPQLAIREAVVGARGPLGHELRAALRAVDLGGRWRLELAAAAERLALPDLRRTVSLLARSESLGSALQDEMARLAIDVRASRRADATERARIAPVKMLFPLVFLILPAFLLLTVVPVLLTTVRSIG